MKLAPYPEYKDSGLPWLGKVPRHWDVLPHRALFQEIKDQGHVDEPLLSVTISKGVIRQSDLLADSSKKDSSNLDKSKYKLVAPGDIAYNKMRAWQGAVGASRFRGIVSPAYVVVRPRRNDNPEFFHYLFRTPGFVKEAERWSYGITSDMWSLRPEHFKMIYSGVPARPEQDAIVRFLRHFESKVRRYIRNRRRLIEVLNEQKQAIINRAVTEGLDPNVRMKDSGVEWLEEIPEHWEVRRLKDIFRERDERTDTGTEILFSLRLKAGLVPHNSVSEKPISDNELVGYKKVHPGQLVMNRMRASIGMFAAVSAHGLVSPDYAIFDPVSKIDVEYFVKLFQTQNMKVCFRIESKGLGTGESGFLRLYSDRFGRIKISMPPFPEQNAILNWINEECTTINAVISKAEQEIGLVNAYRTRLISDVVMGKVDVRESSAHLLEEFDEPESSVDEQFENTEEEQDYDPDVGTAIENEE